MNRRIFRVLLVVCGVILPIVAGAGVDEAREALCAHEFEAALEATATPGAGASAADGGEAWYLHALALYELQRYEDASTAAARAEDAGSDPWARKARFLRAAAGMAMRRHGPPADIYEEEAIRLLSPERKAEIAHVYIDIGDELSRLPGADELSAPAPDYGKAATFYEKALELEIDPELKRDLQFRRARAVQLAGDANRAAELYRDYLKTWDAAWRERLALGPLPDGTPALPEIQGLRTRFLLARADFDRGDIRSARNLAADIGSAEAAVAEPGSAEAAVAEPGSAEAAVAEPGSAEAAVVADDELAARAMLLRFRAFEREAGRPEMSLAAVKAADEFIERFPAHPEAVNVAFRAAELDGVGGRTEEAMRRFAAFVERDGFETPETVPERPATLIDALVASAPDEAQSAAKRYDELAHEAQFQVGQVRLSRKEYDDAREAFSGYLRMFPDGGRWTAAQQGILDSRYLKGLDLVAEEEYDAACEIWDAFLEEYPLDQRARRILYVYGRIEWQQAVEIRDADDGGDPEPHWRRAIGRWEQLIAKYPGSEEASLAQWEIGRILEEELGELKPALAAYRKLDWGSRAQAATERVGEMTRKSLELSTPRIYRGDEPAAAEITVRNIETLTAKLYALDLEQFFRKTHGVVDIESLDLALIDPDEEWEVEVDDYAEYLPIEQRVELPVEDGAGVWALKISGGDLESTTLVIRSDLDVIVKSSRRSVLVYAQEMTSEKPAEGVRVLVSDGNGVVVEGETNEDGVFLGEADELDQAGAVRVFARRDDDVAAAAVAMEGLGRSAGLSARGFVYTDRPVYLPGTMVGIKAIVRSVKDEQYAVETGLEYTLTVLGPNGRLLHSEDVEINRFGTIAAEMALPEQAPSGEYAIRLRAKDRPTVTGTFRVEQFQLQKVRLELEFDRTVYFPGDAIEATFRAATYDGRPVAASPVRYRLPDGRELVDETDEEGEIRVTFETGDRPPGIGLEFHATLEQEGVSASGVAMLAATGFRLRVDDVRPVVLAGEAVEAVIRADDIEGEPVDREVTVVLVRRERRKVSPVLSALPWAATNTPVPWADVEVETRTVTTGEEGEARVSFTPDDGGVHRIRVTGEDRMGQPIAAGASFLVSDDEDAVRLRLFAEEQTVKVGEAVDVNVLWRESAGPALVTFEGEEVLGYRIERLGEESTPLSFDVAQEHFPNFTLAVARMDGRKLHQAAVPFVVERALRIEVEPAEQAFAPGEDGSVTVTVTDQVGRPVETELSLALVQEALFDLYGDPTPDLRGFFQQGVVRESAMRTSASNGFEYRGRTVGLVAAVEQELARLRMVEMEGAERLGRPARHMARIAREADPELLNDAFEQAADALMQTGEGQSFGRQSAAGSLLALDGVDLGDIDADGDMRLSSRFRFTAGSQMQGVASSSRSMQALGDRPPASQRGRGDFGGAVLGYGGGGQPPAAGAWFFSMDGGRTPGPRREVPGSGVWMARIETDEAGRAEIDVPFPDETTLWRIVTRGCSAETLVGEATAPVQTRRELFVEVQAPSVASEGDKLRPPVTVHYLGDDALDATLRLVASSGETELDRFTRKIRIEPRSRERYVFDEVETPATAAMRWTAELEVEGALRDSVAVDLPVRPWGMERTAYRAGSAAAERTVFLEADPSLTGTRRMRIEFGEQARSAVIDAALGQWRPLAASIARPRSSQLRTASDLLACAAALEYAEMAKAPPADVAALRARARGLAAALVASQRDDGMWAWTGTVRNEQSDAGSAEATARALWALATARARGIEVEPAVIDRAATVVDQRLFRGASASQRDYRAMLLWSLATVDRADFASANRLYRERASLSPIGLAYTALTLDRLGRTEMADELVPPMLASLPEDGGDAPALLRMETRRSDRLWWTTGASEATAVATLAIAKVRPTEEALPRLVAAVEGVRTGCLPEVRGAAVAALARYYGRAERAEADFLLTVRVNDTEVARRIVTGAVAPETIDVPAELVKAGENRIEFQYDGRGAYAYAVALSGWSTTFPEDRPWGEPFPYRRRTYHAPLRYRGRAMGQSSQEVGQVRVGEVARVSVNMDDGGSWRPMVVREPIPAGCDLVPGSVTIQYDHLEVVDGELILSFRPNRHLHSFDYQVVGRVPGSYRVGPTTMIDALDPSLATCGKESELTVLGPGEQADYEYEMNCGELWAFAEATFNDNLFADSLEYLQRLREKCRDGWVPQKEKLLVWILSRPEFYDPDGLVDAFEVLKERDPELWVPFEKMLAVGRAYRDKDELERAALVYRATIEASFYRDARGGGVLEGEGRFLASMEFVDRLLAEYPDLPPVLETEFGLTQLVYRKASDVGALKDELRRRAGPDADPEEITRIDLLEETVARLRRFRALHPSSPLGDDAAFSEANALLDLRDYDEMIDVVRLARRIYPADANYSPQFPYMEALGLFHRRSWDDAVSVAKQVAASDNENKDYAVYILGQIFHTKDEPGHAVPYYRRVADLYPDAKGSLEFFEEKRLSLPEVTTVRPGEPVGLEVESRNLTEAGVQVYRVDLMTLYLREKDLSRVAEVHLAGIAPKASMKLELADEIDFRDHTTPVELPIEEEGAYLVLVRGDDLFASGLVLVTSLEIEVQEDPGAGTVRVNVRRDDAYAEGVHVKVVGSADGEVRAGDTDPRGIVAVDGVRGTATAIARDEERRYAFHRGDQWLGLPVTAESGDGSGEPPTAPVVLTDLASNLKGQVSAQWDLNVDNQMRIYNNDFQGVQVMKAY